MSKLTGKLALDFETADAITLLNLKDARKMLKKELRDYEKGKWLHPEDVVRNAELIDHLDVLIKYYGG